MPPPCGGALGGMAFCREVFLLDTQKEPKRCPLLPIAREARPRGPAPWEPQRGGRRSKKLKRAGVLHVS